MGLVTVVVPKRSDGKKDNSERRLHTLRRPPKMEGHAGASHNTLNVYIYIHISIYFSYVTYVYIYIILLALHSLMASVPPNLARAYKCTMVKVLDLEEVLQHMSTRESMAAHLQEPPPPSAKGSSRMGGPFPTSPQKPFTHPPKDAQEPFRVLPGIDLERLQVWRTQVPRPLSFQDPPSASRSRELGLCLRHVLCKHARCVFCHSQAPRS